MSEPGSRTLPDYNEPTKSAARLQALAHAVELMTTRREEAAVVPEDHVDRIRAALRESDIPGYRYVGDSCKDDDIRSWRRFRSNALGKRTPDELTVAYLAGPQPSNDLKALIALGLRPENIWAFEIGADEIFSGLADLDALGLRGVKFIPVNMDEYFASTPKRFDIIYVDACGPLPSESHRTTRLLIDIFKHAALAPLGVLITNYSRPDVSKSHTLDTYGYLIAAYLYPKGFMEGDEGGMVEGPPAHDYLFQNEGEPGKCFLSEVKTNFERHYGAFITRHILDIASIIAPTVRLSTSKLLKILFDPNVKTAAERAHRFVRFKDGLLEEAEGADLEIGTPPDPSDFDIDGDAIVDPDMYSLLWTMAAGGAYTASADLPSPSPETKKFMRRWSNQFTGSPQSNSVEADDLIAAFYGWRQDRNLWSNAMKEMGEFPYRDLMPSLCDVPTAEVGFYPAFAQLAYPAHGNVSGAKRFRYIAEGRSTPMFMDVMPFDECRYVYDWLSAVHLLPNDWFDLSAQLTFRFALDAIAKNLRWYGSDFLFGCHVVGISGEFPAAELDGRIDLSESILHRKASGGADV